VRTVGGFISVGWAVHQLLPEGVFEVSCEGIDVKGEVTVVRGVGLIPFRDANPSKIELVYSLIATGMSAQQAANAVGL
jgi:hypothetical protein